MVNAPNKNIILFDGVCNFCNSSVNLIIKRDKKNIFKFAALQSNAGNEITLQRSKEKNNIKKLDTVMYMEDGVLHTKSTAALRILKKLGGVYSLFYGLIIIPRPLRDFIYDIVARNRYKWFGERESCMIPTAEVRQKFLD